MNFLKSIPWPIKTLVGLLLAGLLFLAVAPKASKPNKKAARAQEKKWDRSADSLRIRQQELALRQLRQDSASRRAEANTRKKVAIYNNTVVKHKAENAAHNNLPAAARHAANLKLIRSYRPVTCTICDSSFRRPDPALD